MVLIEGGLAQFAAPNTNHYDDIGNGCLLFYADLKQQVLESNQEWKMKVYPAYNPNSG